MASNHGQGRLTISDSTRHALARLGASHLRRIALVFVCACGILLFANARRPFQAISPSSPPRPSDRVLQSPVNAVASCQRVLLIDYANFNYGFGAAQLAMVQAAYFAQQYGYQLLFSRGANPYGHYLDYFTPPIPTCTPSEQDHDVAFCYRNRTDCVTMEQLWDDWGIQEYATDRLVLDQNNVYSVNEWLVSKFWDSLDALKDLPTLDANRPLPLPAAEGTLPPLMRQPFELLAPLFDAHFKLNSPMEDLVSERRAILEEMRRDHDEAPIVGVHFRGGDKLWLECKTSIRLSWLRPNPCRSGLAIKQADSGNVTMHAEAAWSAVQPFMDGKADVKPVLALLTAEEDIFAQFEKDPIGQRFHVVELPHGEQQASYDQTRFNYQDANARLGQTRAMLADLTALARYADTFVVSTTSNLGRFAMLLAGLERIDEGRMIAFDLWWHPSLFAPVWPVCDGRSNVCRP